MGYMKNGELPEDIFTLSFCLVNGSSAVLKLSKKRFKFLYHLFNILF